MRLPLSVTAFFLAVALTGFAADGLDQARYVFPPNLSLTLAPSGTLSPSGTGIVKGRISSRLGTLRQLQIFFECSPDLAVSPQKTELAELAETPADPKNIKGAGKEFSLAVTKGPGKPDEMGSWVRMRVRYLPDFARIQAVVGDPKAYPVDFERRRLLDVLARNRKSQSPYTDATRFFLK